jgi:hypothetical protein
MEIEARYLGKTAPGDLAQFLGNFIEIPESVDAERENSVTVNGGRPFDESTALCKRGSRKPRLDQYRRVHIVKWKRVKVIGHVYVSSVRAHHTPVLVRDRNMHVVAFT